jgi:protein-tyrosine phosphatase
MFNLASALVRIKKLFKPVTDEEEESKDERKKKYLFDEWIDYDKIHQIYPNLFLTSAKGASNLKKLKKLGITHILVAANFEDSLIKINYFDAFKYKTIKAEDDSDQNILDFFPDVFSWIDDALKNKSNKVLIHCAMGISRGPAFTIGYLMYSKKMSYHEALAHIRLTRPIANPNRNFERQLLEFEKDQETIMSKKSMIV